MTDERGNIVLAQSGGSVGRSIGNNGTVGRTIGNNGSFIELPGNTGYCTVDERSSTESTLPSTFGGVEDFSFLFFSIVLLVSSFYLVNSAYQQQKWVFSEEESPPNLTTGVGSSKVLAAILLLGWMFIQAQRLRVEYAHCSFKYGIFGEIYFSLLHSPISYAPIFVIAAFFPAVVALVKFSISFGHGKYVYYADNWRNVRGASFWGAICSLLYILGSVATLIMFVEAKFN